MNRGLLPIRRGGRSAAIMPNGLLATVLVKATGLQIDSTTQLYPFIYCI